MAQRTTTGTLIFLYPGQGAQYPGMIRDIFEASSGVKELFTLASDCTGIDMKALLFEADETELKKTEHTQAAITLANIAVRKFLSESGIESSAVAGFSLGEYAALADAGVLTEEAVFRLVVERGRLMAEAIEEGAEGAMAAVIGIDAQTVDKIIEGIEGVYPANYNAPLQTVISGTHKGLESAATRLKEAGARRVVPLKVAGPFHTPLLEGASARFAELIEYYQFSSPVKPLFSNVTGTVVVSSEKIRGLCARQIISPVRWTTVESSICEMKPTLAIESGPGKVLSGLWKSSSASVPCLSVDNREAALAARTFIENS
ncbi:ACP S-malonyltransferase [Sediminispirochaeta smaragdinae]|uniref:Malonyl CoA-acyl carrier protein transacylase n=1 Tax=Sediminispirochaeta smaragdinae (strain DSM 11293 / JCM 15392 / SEBR 4228) TaxID=573413 RepID=E1R1N7_SEDSS|nr:ACP S-malonyltransferase [Sediminispirochaeta smaragdinae]ADK81413.1 Acyl transferase [Sediminispirochaeta smaragdinae DSM 11293]